MAGQDDNPDDPNDSGDLKRGDVAQRRRIARQAAALRDNLFRRKAQARARREFDISAVQGADAAKGRETTPPSSPDNEG